MSDTTLTEKEATNLVVNLVCNKLFILAPLYFKQISGFSAFITTTFVFAITFLVWKFYCNFSAKPIYALIYNPLLKKFFIAFIVIICALITAVTINQYSLEIKATVLHKTPLGIITFIFLTVMLLSIKFKLKSIGTVSVIFVPAIYFVALTLIIISVNKNDLYNLFPVIDTSNNTILKKALLMLSMLFEFIFLYFLPDFLQNASKTPEVGNRIIFRSYVNYLIISIIFSIVLPEFANGNTEPFFKIVKQAHLVNSNVRLDSIFLILYCISAFIYISAMLLFVFRITGNTFKKLAAFSIKIICILLIFTVTLLSAASEFIFGIISKYYFILCLITFILPIVIMIMNKVLKCKSKE